ncbi:hypothetical protein [Aegicerativicinus sediminis]|uniref:hypothetical protein n=1 Tax=Aegicerativicinus sediminis TaxID=2893202 RepID=UPI001E4ACEB1|nr:hypothetical protein [Aegicerativicinus sediminis]
MERSIEKRLNLLSAYALISTIVFGFLLLTSVRSQDKNEQFDEITVKKINVVAEDGELRMVLSNETRQHPGRMNGKDFEKRDRPAGILFFNEEGDECGGLIYHGKTENSQTYSGMSFTMDQYKEDQVIQILNSESYKDGKERISRGIAISDLPTGSDLITRINKIEELQKKLKSLSEKEAEELVAKIGNSLGSKRRLFLGRTGDNNSGLYLSDPNGVVKIKIYVDEGGNPVFEVKDNQGNFNNILNVE